MKIFNILKESLTNGKGARDVVFFSGCEHKCKGCHNKDLWDIEAGIDMTAEDVVGYIVSNYSISRGLTLSGGDPFLQPKGVLELVKKFKKIYPHRDIWCYTGYTLEELQGLSEDNILIKESLNYIDVLVTGRYVEELNPTLNYIVKPISELNNIEYNVRIFTGSSNQRVLVKENNNWVDCDYNINKEGDN